jgi:hypothetical protein
MAQSYLMDLFTLSQLQTEVSITIYLTDYWELINV